MPTTFYPSIRDILPVDAIPNELGFVKDGITNLVSKIYYKNLQFSKNDRGDSAFYCLDIISLQRLDIEIPGTGLFLILNPPPVGQPDPEKSEFPIIVSYTWPILGYLRNFNLANFSFAPGDLFDLALAILDVTEQQLVERALAVFVTGPNPINQFVDSVNAQYGTSISYPAAASADPVAEVLGAMEGTGSISGAGVAVFTIYLLDTISDGNTEQRLKDFFNSFYGGDVVAYIKNLLIPQAEATLEITAGIEFPRNILVPLDAVGGIPIADPTIKTMLRFDAGKLYFSTQRGIGFDQMLTAQLDYPSQIGDTGFGISLNKAKLDISRTINIPEADADGRPADFVGVYIEEATISFPLFWNHDEAGSTGVILGRKMIIGTGGFSGTLGLEAKTAGDAAPIIKAKFGDDFQVSLDRFSITLKQNAFVSSLIEGTIRIPGFKDANNNPADVRVKVDIHGDGDFDITAQEDDGFKEILFGNIFGITLKTIFFGKKDDDFYFGVSGSIRFLEPTLAGLLKGNIELEKLLIWSDGRLELEGGTLPLPEGASIDIGPVKIAITAIHFGSYQQEHNGEMRKYRYFGFDGGLSLNPGGVDARGDGIKFYYSVDSKPLHTFLRIQSIALDLIIPGNASKETATALISGYLTIKEAGSGTEYEGGIKFALPKAKIAGGASMKYAPAEPSWIVDAFVELAAPLPLGATGLGIYGFRGLVGHRYVASKDVTSSSTWFDYYKAPPEEGVVVAKFKTPDETENDSNPFSVGAGISLATTADNGKAFSSKLFLLLSLPEVFYLEGKANIVGERVGLTGDDPPFFAYLAISSTSVETGFGADYKIPKNGLILKIYAEIQAGFFFNDPKAWYINFGTEDKRIQATLLSLFTADSYLMLSASGIKGGGRVEYEFDKKYAGGVVSVHAEVYLEIGGRVSFERPQIGGFAMVGGHVDAYFLCIGFYIGLDASLSVEAPKPFLIKGSVDCSVGVTIGFWRFKKRIEKNFTIEFIWEKSTAVDENAIIPFNFETSAIAERPPLKGINMISGEDFDLHYFGTSVPSAGSAHFNTAVIPLDTWIDIEFTKGLLHADIDGKIGGFANVSENYLEQVPPDPNARIVTHQYTIRALDVKAWTGVAWVDYNPFEAVASPEALAELGANPSEYTLGKWQLMGKTHNKIRLLGETSFSYMQQGQPGWYTPEQFGITSATLFCKTKLKKKNCIRWTGIERNTKYDDGKWYQMERAFFRVVGNDGHLIDWDTHFNIPRSVIFTIDAQMEIVFPVPCAETELKLTTFTHGVDIQYYSRKWLNGFVHYTLEKTRTLNRYDLLSPVQESNPDHPIAKIIIQPHHPDFGQLDAIRVEIERLQREFFESREPDKDLPAKIKSLEDKLQSIIDKYCDRRGISDKDLIELVEQLLELQKKCVLTLAKLRKEKEVVCKKHKNLRDLFQKNFKIVPARFSFDIDRNEKNEFTFLVSDHQTDSIILRSADTYQNEKALIDATELALAYAITNEKAFDLSNDENLSFNLADTNGQLLFRGGSQLKSAVERNELASSLRTWLLEKWEDDHFQPGALKIPATLYGDEEIIPGGEESANDNDLIKLKKDLALKQALYDYQVYHRNWETLLEWENKCAELDKKIKEQETACGTLAARINWLKKLLAGLKDKGILAPPKIPCATLVHQVCYLTLEDYEFNINVPGQEALEQSYQQTADAIEKMLKPIWRPDTKYYVHLKVEDEVQRELEPKIQHVRDYYFGFRTAGPVGYFHKDPHAGYVPAGDEPDKYSLTSLRPYIDYIRSYPDAEGNLIHAKPLFYEDARLLIFYVDRYAYHMFGNWPAYNGLPAFNNSRLQVVVKDPTEDVEIENPVPPDIVTTTIPQAIEEWPVDDDPRIPEDIRALLNMRNPELLNPDFEGGECWVSGGDMIRPASVYTEVTMRYLKPLKLYTALFNNLYREQSAQVHRYVFQTSRYPDFNTQVNSYHLDDGKGNTRDAIFRIDPDVTNDQVDLAYDIVSNTLSVANQQLATAFADAFDRLIVGALALTPLDAAVSTEFNILRQQSTGRAFAVWIRNPEPFNDPKIPAADIARGIGVLGGWSVDPSYNVLYSKDRSQAIVMNTAKNISSPSLRFRFVYLEWDGRNYINKVVVNSSPINIL